MATLLRRQNTSVCQFINLNTHLPRVRITHTLSHVWALSSNFAPTRYKKAPYSFFVIMYSITTRVDYGEYYYNACLPQPPLCQSACLIDLNDIEKRNSGDRRQAYILTYIV